MKFYLGTHMPNWLWHEDFHGVPLFVSNNVLRRRKGAFQKAQTSWALDSGGFSEIKANGRWTVTPQEYIDKIERYVDELGNLDWAAPQDWMCEPVMLAKTGLTVLEHQQRTVDNYLTLTSMAPHLPFVPVLQGFEVDEYERCVKLYEAAGVDLTMQRTVGIGSVCRRQGTNEIDGLITDLTRHGIKMHGFGVKTVGLAKYGPLLTSADSMAWSFGGRYEAALDGCSHKNCANCPLYALRWYRNVLAKMLTED